MTQFAQHLTQRRAGWRLAATLASFIAAAASTLAAPPARAQDAAAAAESRAAAPRYRVANLGSGVITRYPRINSSGQVAFSLFDGQTAGAWVFDGKRIIKLGTLGGSTTYTSGINERGQVAGWSSRSDEGVGINGAFRWTRAGGLVDLGSLGDVWSYGNAINNNGAVAGNFGGRGLYHAFRWNAAAGMEDLGILGDSESNALAMNDDGLIAGTSLSAAGVIRAFVWTRSRGIEDIGTLGGQDAIPVAVGARGEVVGDSDTAGTDNARHAFRWTRAGGMRDLGALDGSDSAVKAMSPNGDIIGTIVRNNILRAMTWSAAHGMVDLGTLGGSSAQPGGINSLGQAVGAAADRREAQRAFIWTRARGMSDLNSHLLNAPTGLILEKAEAVADDGAIVASSNAGLVLLRPVNQERLAAPVLGPIELSRAAGACCAIDMKVAFTDGNPGGQHQATVDWGDAVMAGATVTERGGEGSAGARHDYQLPGLYSVVVTVTDRGGNATSLRRDLIVEAGSQRAAGSGRFMAPLGADRGASRHAGAAALRFVAPGAQGAGGMLSFVTDRQLFRASSMSAAANIAATPGVQGLSGVGQLNGRAGFHYAMTVAADAGSPGRVGLRIWHIDPVSKQEISDFDNTQDGGSKLVDGAIALAR